MFISRIAKSTGLAAALCLCSCGDSSTGSKDDGSGWFPGQVGMLWVYEVYDSLTATADTVFVSVTDTALYQRSLPHFIWRTYWTKKDTVIDRRTITSGDTVDFLSGYEESDLILTERFVFPPRVGQQWAITDGDTSTVLEIDSFSVPAGNFRNVALIEETYNPEGVGKTVKTWVARNVGIVARYEFLATLVRVQFNRSWRLLRYDLTTFPLSRFPLSEGMSWRYEVRDSALNHIDTVRVSVGQSIHVPWGDSARVWHYAGRASEESLFVVASSRDILFAHDTLFNSVLDWYYQFPLTVGRHWGFDYLLMPVPIIDDKMPVTTPAGTFKSSFHYRMSGGAFNSYWEIEEWFVPRIGAVKRRITTEDLGPQQTETWVLLSWQPH